MRMNTSCTRSSLAGRLPVVRRKKLNSRLWLRSNKVASLSTSPSRTSAISSLSVAFTLAPAPSGTASRTWIPQAPEKVTRLLLASRAVDPAPTYPLEPSGEEMRALVAAAMERIVRHVESLPGQPAAVTEGGAELARALREPLPQTGAPLSELLDLLFERAVPHSFNTAGPGYLAYIPGGGIFHAALADLIADSVNRYVGVFAAAPGLAQLEANVVRWLAEIVGYPSAARGILTSGG